MAVTCASGLDELVQRIRACRACEDVLPLGPRPVLQVAAGARLMICSQAPGTRVHETGLPFNDRSGDRLRQWLGLDRTTFYDPRRVAIVPMGFCYPGRNPRGGDNPPRPECARLWHDALMPLLAGIELTVVVGQYAIAWHLKGRCRPSMTETVAAWRDYLPRYLPLPHPSWRNTGWLARNPWFAAECLPVLQAEVRRLTATG